jgi:hypothetical protein
MVHANVPPGMANDDRASKRLGGGEKLMRPRRSSILSIALFTALALAGVASAQERPKFLWGPGEARFAVGAGVDQEIAAAMARLPIVSPVMPTWNGSFTFGSAYPFTMIGTDPALGSKSTTVKTIIVPVIFSFSGGTVLNPTKKVCGGKSSALTLTRQSPIFQSFDYPTGGTSVGKSQYGDAFQRANFWANVSTTSPKYHVLLSKTGQTAAVKVIVPPADGFVTGGSCASIGEVDIGWFDGVVVPQLLSHFGQIKPNVLPIFLNYNVFMTEFGSCCILGYHSAGVTANGIQTYADAAFSDPGIFSVAIEDVMALGHEVAEWMDDPLGTNPTPPWGNIGQVSGCQNNLEDGDALTGTVFTETGSNHFTYHLQDLTVLSFFSRVTPSTSANGWYSFIGTFLNPSKACPPGGLGP